MYTGGCNYRDRLRQTVVCRGQLWYNNFAYVLRYVPRWRQLAAGGVAAAKKGEVGA